MEPYHCDLCQETVPSADLAASLAVQVGDRVICRACDQAMGGAVPPKSADAPPGGGAGSRQQIAPKTHARAGVGVAVALALASTLLTLVAVVFLLIRGEKASRDWSDRFDENAAELADLQERERGTREHMVARAGEVTEEVLHDELARFDTLQRQVEELRQAIFVSPPAEAPDSAEGTAGAIDSGLLTAGDAMERIGELEEQLLFLQTRLFDLAEAQDSSPAPSGGAPPAALPAGDIGALVERLDHDDPIERVTALFRLATVDDPGIVRHVIERLEDRDRYIRALAARTLERLEARSAVPSLITALEDPESTVRECAVSALRTITGELFLFDPLGTREERLRVVVLWRKWWKENWKGFLYEED